MTCWMRGAVALVFSTSLLAPVVFAALAAKTAPKTEAPAKAARDPGDVAVLLDAFPLGKPLRKLFGNFIEIRHVAATVWEFNLEVIAVITEVDKQGANDHAIHRHPDWATPVAVAAKQA